ncbi:MAG TPA: TerD family protein [Nakamurella sp.]|nr:TerD family protein [Nakamurella sp.]
MAHNAVFDWGFLQAESLRCVADLDSRHRLCTLALARRLDLDVRDFKLGTLAAWANIRQQQAHSAVDDVRVLEAIFLKLMAQAIRGQVTLPMSVNTAAVRLPYGERAPSVSSSWSPVGRWIEGTLLVQGMRFVITGGTRTPRAELYATGISAGLTPMNSVSTKTSVLVCNDPNLLTRKASRAGELATTVMTEDRFTSLLRVVQPGNPISARPVVRSTPAASSGPLKGCRVLVLGGPHAASARVRDEVMARGGRVAVNLTPTVSHLIVLDAADTDIRYARTTHLLRLDPTTLQPHPVTLPDSPAEPEPGVRQDQPGNAPRVPPDTATPAAPPVPELSTSAARILRRGEVTDLPDELSTWDLFVSWTLADPPLELDVVAFVTDAEEKVLSDEHFVFFNALETPGGEVRLEIETNGESRLAVDLDELSIPGVRVIVGASLAGGRTFGELGPVELTLRDTDGGPWARTVQDAGTTENSLVLAEFYQRGNRWRFRAVGQGYEEPLAGFAVRHGVDVA